jgi:hypothetical protein
MLPTSFLLDRQGRIRHTVKGFFAEATLSRAVERLLAEPSESTCPEQPSAATNLEELAAAQVAP